MAYFVGTSVDGRVLKDSFATVAGYGDEVPMFFYSYLFVAYPQTRELFPVSMARQRDRLVRALGRLVSDVEDLDHMQPLLRQLGRDHRRFGAVSAHYPAVGEALLATLAHFLGAAWTPALAEQWRAAYELFAQAMIQAADEVAQTSPPYWEAEVIGYERRGLDIAVIQVRPEQPYDYLPGQSMAVECALRPRLWRYYSPANAPRPDGVIELQVRMVIGGQVSSALVHSLRVGDVLRLGAPVGHRLTLPTDDPRDILLLAGGTGLAPLRALVEQVAAEGGRRAVRLFVGGEDVDDLYDLPTLSRYQQVYPWLTVVPVVSADPHYQGERGHVVDVVLAQGRWDDHRVYVCGSPDMVVGTVDRLLASGVDKDALCVEDVGDG